MHTFVIKFLDVKVPDAGYVVTCIVLKEISSLPNLVRYFM